MSNDARDIEWRCGCGQTNPDYDERCRGCGQERYGNEMPSKEVSAAIVQWAERVKREVLAENH